MDLLKQYTNSITPPHSLTLQDIDQFIEWRNGLGAEDFIPDFSDDVALRSYLTTLRIQGAPQDTLKRVASSLEGFYTWLAEQGLAQENPFVKYNLTGQVLKSARFPQLPEIITSTSQQEEIAHLRAINQLAESTNGASDVQSMINVTLDTLLGVLSLHTAWISLRTDYALGLPIPDPSPAHGFILAAARNLPGSLEQSDCHYLTRAPACHCQMLLRTGHMKRAFNVVECDRLRDAAQAAGEQDGLRFHASVPVFSGDQAIGVMNFATEDWRVLSATDLHTLSTAAELLRSALQRAQLYDESVKHRIQAERELDLAHKIQVSLLPSELPGIPGYNLAAYWKPARQVSGDYYGVYQLSSQRWGLVAADVTDKGAPAALMMAMTYSLIRERVENESSPARLLARVNQVLCQQLNDSSFVTCFYAVLDPIRHTLTYATAGQNPPVLRKEGGHTTQLIQGGMVLGIQPESTYENHTLDLEEGDSLVIFTDGVTDALNPAGKPYELDRLEAVLRAAPAAAGAILEKLEQDLFAWADTAPQFDDITMLVVHREAS